MRNSFLYLVLVFGGLIGTALNAQMDPKLQACETDVLDIYSGGKKGAMPEIVTLVDDSASTYRLAWDKRYYTDLNIRWHKPIAKLSSSKLLAGGNHSKYGDYPVFVFQVVASTLNNANNVYYGVKMHLNDPGGEVADFDALTEGILIKPDGNPVTSAAGATAESCAAQASHVRFAITSKASSPIPTYTYGGKTYKIPSANCGIKARKLTASLKYDSGDYVNIDTPDNTRVIDIPLPWAVFDRVPQSESRSLTPAPFGPTGDTSLNIAKTNNHPQHTYLFDKVPNRASGAQSAAAQYYEIDTRWWQRNSKKALNSSTFYGFDCNPDYIVWCLLGQDVKTSSIDGTVAKYTGSNSGGYVVADARDGAAGFCAFTRDDVDCGNGLPNMSRMQAIKYALIKTWINEQLNVWWAVRFLTSTEDTTNSACFDSRNAYGNDDRKLLRLLRPTSSTEPHSTLKLIQNLNPTKSTPLTSALINTYAQLATEDGNDSVFKPTSDPELGESTVPSCRRTFVIVLSDGSPNDAGLGSGDPFSGGDFKQINFGDIAPSKSYFNIWSLAGVTAHLDPKSGDATTWPSDKNTSKPVKPPFKIITRPLVGTNNVPPPRRISTMTIGVSLAGTRNDSGTPPKEGMYRTALYGWEERKSFSTTSLPLPFAKGVKDQSDAKVNPFFFDAQSPEDIAEALSETMNQTRAVTNVMSAPVAPLVGLGVGNEMYLATFMSNKDKCIWTGDLMTVGMRAVGNKVTLLDKSGNAIGAGDTINNTNAIWAVSNLFTGGKSWKDRKLFTFKADKDNAGKYKFFDWNELTSTTNLSNEELNVSNTAGRLNLIRFMMGAHEDAQKDAAAESSIRKNRDDIVGDIINSTPTVLEFPVSMAKGDNLIWLNSKTDCSQKHYRLIVVGDNQGILHGYGEVSCVDAQGLLQARIDELWGIIPPDFHKYLDSWRNGISTVHRYLVDGTPVLYLNETGTPNGVIDGTDFVRLLFGLRKGGRSYYSLAFTDNNPEKPYVVWGIDPENSSDTTVKNMGFSTSTPVASRIFFENKIKDVFFIGGGLSTSKVDEAFGTNVKLGRCILAADVYDGKIIKKWDFINDASLNSFNNIGCIASGPTAVEVLVKSYKTQRVYFADYTGGVYCLGAKADTGLRLDTAAIDDWKVRAIFKTKYPGTVISSTPAVFPLPYGYPTDGFQNRRSVFTMGVAFGTGDRNDPMDRMSVHPTGGGVDGNSNRFVVAMDRDDSADDTTNAPDSKGYNEDMLADLTKITTSDAATSSIYPSSSDYYLKTKIGYRLEYKKVKTDTGYYEKTVISPLIINKSLYFTKFTPNETTDVCTPAGGISRTYRMSDVMSPIYSSGEKDVDPNSSDSGCVKKFNDIPSELASVGLGAVLQVGEVTDAGSDGSGGAGRVTPSVIEAPPISNLTRPRAWRIIR